MKHTFFTTIIFLAFATSLFAAGSSVTCTASWVESTQPGANLQQDRLLEVKCDGVGDDSTGAFPVHSFAADTPAIDVSGMILLYGVFDPGNGTAPNTWTAKLNSTWDYTANTTAAADYFGGACATMSATLTTICYPYVDTTTLQRQFGVLVGRNPTLVVTQTAAAVASATFSSRLYFYLIGK